MKDGAVKRSDSTMYVEPKGKELVWYLQVKGHGVLVVRTTSNTMTGRLRVERAAALEKGAIGFCPDL